MTTNSQSLPADASLEEEENPDYDSRRFYPVRVGEVVQKYQTISKLGWGTGSTVWLAKDIDRFVQCPSQLAGNNKVKLVVATESIRGAQNYQLL